MGRGVDDKEAHDDGLHDWLHAARREWLYTAAVQPDTLRRRRSPFQNDAAGLTPADALATVTINPAREYRLADQTGSIVKGKLAELALIDGDPSKNIGDLRQVELVMRDGKLMDAQALRASVGISGPPKK